VYFASVVLVLIVKLQLPLLSL